MPDDTKPLPLVPHHGHLTSTIGALPSQHVDFNTVRQVMAMVNLMSGMRRTMLTPNIARGEVYDNVKTDAQDIIDTLNEFHLRLLQLNDDITSARNNLPALRFVDGTRQSYAELSAAIRYWTMRMPTTPPGHRQEHALFKSLHTFFTTNLHRAVVIAKKSETVAEVWRLRRYLDTIATVLLYIDRSYQELDDVTLALKEQLSEAQWRLDHAPQELTELSRSFQAAMKRTDPDDPSFAGYPPMPPPMLSSNPLVQCTDADAEAKITSTAIVPEGIQEHEEEHACLTPPLLHTPEMSAELQDRLTDLNEFASLKKIQSEPAMSNSSKRPGIKGRSGSMTHMGRVLPLVRADGYLRKNSV